MKNKVVILLTTVLMAGNIKLGAQTYYNPKDEINITLTIKEPFKPINYYEIGKNFNNMLQEEAARREALKGSVASNVMKNFIFLYLQQKDVQRSLFS